MAIAGMKLSLDEDDRTLLRGFAQTLFDFTQELKRYNDDRANEIITVDMGTKGQFTGPRHQFPKTFQDIIDTTLVMVASDRPNGPRGLNHRIQAAEGHLSTWHTHRDIEALDRCLAAFGGQAE